MEGFSRRAGRASSFLRLALGLDALTGRWGGVLLARVSVQPDTTCGKPDLT